ncbi:acyltransferase family protein [Oceaniradius stylonematis]|uniref:acyltransferase family protein n=1 Tax=Oceaniradius stylonematis TaxID=2184161 RepID=UPI00273D6DB5|nr:acyltransferase [Oceaniradius stylonematis]
MTASAARRYPDYGTFAVWRLLAAMLVMGYHFSFSAPHDDALTTWFEHMNPLLDMFFVLSGFLIYERYHDRVLTRGAYGRFVLRRLSRLYPLHLATLGFFAAVGMAAHAGLIEAGGIDSRYDMSQLLTNLFLLQAWGVHDTLTFNYVSWSLSGEWFAYLMLPVLAFAGLRMGLAGLVAVLALTLAGLEWASRDATDYSQTWYDAKSWGAGRIFADFTFGAILFRIVGRLPARLGSRPAGWMFLGLSIVTMFAGMGTYVALALIGCAIVCVALVERQPDSASSLLTGLAPVTILSYGIYMWHPVMETLFFSGVWKLAFGAPETSLFYLLAAVPVVATFVVAALSLRFFETPAARAIMALGDRQRKAVQPARA